MYMICIITQALWPTRLAATTAAAAKATAAAEATVAAGAPPAIFVPLSLACTITSATNAMATSYP